MTKQMNVEAIKARLSELLAAYQFPSASIGILHDGEITDFAVGLKNVASNEAATTDTIYACASMTKTWAALAFMQLVDEGKVTLDKPVQTFIPGFRVADLEVSATVTPRHLLNHTHGIEEGFGDPGEGEDVYERMVENIRDAPQIHPLGATHAYSPALGYAILARIMELADGKPWDAIMRDRLFTPLGLTSTSSWREQVDQERAVTPYLVRSLEEGPIESPRPYLPRAYGPGGNVTSTPREVLTMASIFLNEGKALNGERILSAASVREMIESRVPLPDPYILGSEWALGLTVHHWHGETVYGHDGGLSGQQSRLRILPESNLAITMLATGVPRDSFYRELFNTILTELGAVTIPDLPGPDLTLKLDPSRYVGAYARPTTRYEVEADDGRLYLTWVLDPMVAEFLGKPDRVRYDLLPIDETHFLMPPSDPLEDTWTVALYDFEKGPAQYLHTVARGFPRVG